MAKCNFRSEKLIGMIAGCSGCTSRTPVFRCEHPQQRDFCVDLPSVVAYSTANIELITGETKQSSFDFCSRCTNRDPKLVTPDAEKKSKIKSTALGTNSANPVSPTRHRLQSHIRNKQISNGTWTEEQVARSMAEIRGPTQPWDSVWHRQPSVHEAHRRLFDEVAAVNYPYPGGFSGRGIVTLAGSEKYFVCGYAMIRLLRALGCQLPIELWYIGRGELDYRMERAASAIPGVTCVNLYDRLDPLIQPRCIGGWEAKVWAILYSPFKEVLFLDADNIPAIDPSFIFDDPNYQEHGAVLWEDLPNEWGLDITEQAFITAGLPVPGKTRKPDHHSPSDYRPIETGQILVDKSRCWKALQLTRHLNDHSDYWYPMRFRGRANWWIYGDKSTFYLAWNKIGQKYAMPKTPGYIGDKLGGGFLQYDFDGRLLFTHKCQPVQKLHLHVENHAPANLVNWSAMADGIRELQALWSGKIWDWADQSIEDRGIAIQAAGWWTVFGLKANSVTLELKNDGSTDSPAVRWTVAHFHDKPHLLLIVDGKTEILGKDDIGNWVNHSKSIFLMPSPPRSWLMVREPEELGMWSDIVIHNEYELPDQFRPGEVVVDIGAHVGVFAMECLKRGAARVICVEPSRDNFASLQANLAGYSDRTVLLRCAAWRSDQPPQPLPFGRPPGAKHTGGGTCWHGPDAVQGMPTDDILKLAAAGGRIRLLKLDCEGSEWPILWTTNVLDLVDEVCGEWHGAWVHQVPGHAAVEGPAYDLAGMDRMLRKTFKDVRFTHKLETIGNFWAR